MFPFHLKYRESLLPGLFRPPGQRVLVKMTQAQRSFSSTMHPFPAQEMQVATGLAPCVLILLMASTDSSARKHHSFCSSMSTEGSWLKSRQHYKMCFPLR